MIYSRALPWIPMGMTLEPPAMAITMRPGAHRGVPAPYHHGPVPSVPEGRSGEPPMPPSDFALQVMLSFAHIGAHRGVPASAIGTHLSAAPTVPNGFDIIPVTPSSDFGRQNTEPKNSVSVEDSYNRSKERHGTSVIGAIFLILGVLLGYLWRARRQRLRGERRSRR